VSSDGINKRIREAVERGNATLASSTARLNSSVARAKVARGWVDRNLAELDRSRVAVERESRSHRDRVSNARYVRSAAPSELRRPFVEIALKLANTEAMVARRHDTMAHDLPERAAECRHIADRAREGERRAHEIAEHFKA
jgi:hypothetical protein